MLKQTILTLVLMTTVACCTPQTWKHPNVLKMTGPEGTVSSSVVIADGWVLTANHTLPVLLVGGLPHGDVIEHPTLDLVLIQCPGVDPRGLVIAQEGPKVYGRLFAYGWHHGEFLMKTEGYQAQQLGWMSAPSIHGCSGGAVVNAGGELVGIITQVRMAPVREGWGYYALPHMARYTVLDEAVRNWIETNIR